VLFCPFAQRGSGANTALALAELASRSEQVRKEPRHAPPQPTNREPFAGTAVNTTGAPPVNMPVQSVAEQRSAAGRLVTFPREPLSTIESRRLAAGPDGLVFAGVSAANSAVTFLAASIVTVQGLTDPVQAPVQPVKWLPPVGAAVRVTWVPESQPIEHAVGQAIPGMSLVTVPPPVIVTPSANDGDPMWARNGESWTSHQLPEWP
jgi:hypothetical protein